MLPSTEQPSAEIASPPAGRPAARLIRSSEWILIGYLAYTALLGLLIGLRPPVRAVLVLLNLTIMAGFALLGYAHSLRRRPLLGVLRDWFPYPLMLLAYREMGWFAPAAHTYDLERAWVVWDRMLLNDWGLRRAIEFFGPLVPAVLELAYLLVYAIPAFSLAMFYVYGHRERVNGFLTVFLLGILIPYTLFPCFPSEPPRTVFPGQDLPAVSTLFRRFNWILLGGYGIHTSVFPSAHVSGAFSAACAMVRLLPEHKWVGRLLAVMAVLIATAVVYGRYHYAADALAGLGTGLLAVGIWTVLKRRSRRSLA